MAGTITSLRVQEKNPNRVSVFLDGAFAFGVYGDLVLEYGLVKGRRLSDDEVAQIQAADAVFVAKATAMHYLAHKARTEAEVRRKLQRSDLPEQAVEQAIQRLHALGYLDDDAYTREYVRSRFRTKGYGPQRLRADLRRRGVAPALIEAALAELLGADDRLTAAREQALQRWPRLAREPDPRKRRKKLSDFLLRRGFTYDTVRQVVDEVAEG